MAEDVGQASLSAIDVKTGQVRTVVKEGTVEDLAAAGDRIVYGLSHLRSPVEIYSVRPDGQ